MRRIIFILLILSPSCHAQLYSGILSSSRATPNWATAGVTGGIPTRNTICSTIAPYGTSGSPASPTTIINAIQACPANEVVLLSPGNFYLNGGIDFANCSLGGGSCTIHNNVTLRGSGADQTFLYISGYSNCFGLYVNICIENDQESYSGLFVEYGAWTAGYSQGATSITITTADVTGLTTGAPVILDQCNTGLSGAATSYTNPGCGTGTATDNGNLFVCDVPSTCNTGSPTGNYRTNRAQSEVHILSGVSCSGSGPYTCTLTLAQGLELPNWVSGASPGIWWAAKYVTGQGIENMTLVNLNTSGASHSFGMIWATNSWITGVRSINGHTAHINIFTSANLTVANSYFYGCTNPGSGCYGISDTQSSDNVFYNNIFQHMTAPVAEDGPETGSVYAYNFSTNNAYYSAPYFSPSDEPHSAGDMMDLYEGEEGLGFDADDIHGTEDMQTLFRNWYSGQATGLITSPLAPIQFYAFQRYGNVIGNVLGYDATNQTSIYQLVAPTGSSYPTIPNGSIYFLGWLGFSGSDSLVASTLMRWGNYDVKTAAVRFCGAGAPGFSSPPCSSVSEVPTGAPTYPNSVPASTTLPPSFYLSTTAHPSGGTGLSWWKTCTNYPTCSGYATPPFPPNGPDVSGGNGLAGYSNHIPAEIAWSTLPIDASYSSTTAVSNATCSSGLATVTLNTPAGSNYPSGWGTLTGITPSGYNGTWNFTGTFSSGSLTSLSFYVPSCPGSYTSGGTFTYPLVRQFNASVYTLDNASGTSTPVISPTPGPYTSPQTITITDSTSGATICYTVDGSTPTANGAGVCTHGATYSTAFSQSIPITVKAMASKSGLTDSGVATNVYTLVMAGAPLSINGGTSIQSGPSIQ